MLKSGETNRSTGFYAPELDGLRWFAVLAVMFAHYSPTLNRHFDWGSPGVRLFFVLSGFLITHILLRARASCDAAQQTPRQALFGFFTRRVFRLWPLYFASLAVAYALKVRGTESPFAWHGLFATNHYVFHYQTWPGLLSHYWTLAVEQQFYLLWPPIILLVPPRTLNWILGAMLVTGPVARWLPLSLGWTSPDMAGVLLPASFDFFALGAAVACLRRTNLLDRLGSRRALRIAMLAAAGWMALGAVIKTQGLQPFYWVVYDASIQGVGFTALLIYFLRYPDGRLANTVRWSPFVYLGQISYGLYVWHNLMHRFGPSLLRRITGESYFPDEPAHVIYYIILTVTVGIISYHGFEAPARQLGQRLALLRSRTPLQVPVPTPGAQ